MVSGTTPSFTEEDQKDNCTTQIEQKNARDPTQHARYGNVTRNGLNGHSVGHELMKVPQKKCRKGKIARNEGRHNFS